jgi:hypothetical protein
MLALVVVFHFSNLERNLYRNYYYVALEFYKAAFLPVIPVSMLHDLG